METISDKGPGPHVVRGSETALLVTILASAAALRLWNLSWGLPDIFEEATPFMLARDFWGSAGGSISFRPDFFHYPALSFYLHFIVQGLQLAGGMVTGDLPGVDAFRGALAVDPGEFMVVARSLSVLFDLGTIWLGWLAARKIFGPGAAIGTALLLTFNPLLLAGARGVNVDVILTFFLMLTLHRTLKLRDRPSTRQFILCGMTVGLAASTKYTGALFMILPAVLIVGGRLPWNAAGRLDTPGTIRRALTIPVTAAVVFLALNPYILIDPAGFLRDFTYEQHHMSYGHLGLDLTQTAGEFYLFGTIVPGLGLLFVAGVAAGAAFAVFRRDTTGIAVVATAAVYLVVISTWVMRADRYLLPAIPLLSILCAAGCMQGTGWVSARLTKVRMFRNRPGTQAPLPRLLPAAVIFAVLVVPIREAFGYLDESGRTDTRTLAREWVEANVAPGSVIASGPFGIGFPSDRQVIYIPFVATGSEATAPFYDVMWYEDFELLIASDYDYGRYSREPDRFRDLLQFYADLRSKWKLLAEISPDSVHRGPKLWFYTPGEIRRTEEFDGPVLERLAAVSDSGLVARFAQNLSGALYSRGRFRKCEQILGMGLRLNPGDPMLTRSLAFLLFKWGKFSEAEEILIRAESDEGDSFDLLSLHGTILVETGDLAGAEYLLLRARQLRPTSTLPYTLLIRIYAERRDTAALIATLERYRLIAPGDGDEGARIGAWLDSLKRAR